MGVKQHLVRLQRIGPNQKRPAMRQLDMGDLKLDPLAADIGPVFAPVELKGFTWLKDQRHKRSTTGCLLSAMSIVTPCPGKSRHTLIGAIISQLHKISVHLLHGSSFFARFACLGQKPRRQTIRIGIQLARSRRCLELRLHRAFAQILLDCVPRQTRPPGNLAYRHFITQCPASNDTQKSHVDHSQSPQTKTSGQCVHMGQFSVTIYGHTGSVLSDNQHTKA